MRSRSPILLTLVAVIAALVPTAARGQVPVGVLSLRGQTTWWTAERPFTLEVAVQTSSPDLEMAVDVFKQVATRSAFAATVDKGVVGRPATQIPPVPLTDLATNDAGDRVLTFVPSARAEGVYPLRVQLRPKGGGAPVDSFVTYLVHVPAIVEGDPLAVGLIVPVHAPPAVQPDGRVAIDDQRAEELAELATSLEDHRDIALSLAPTPETIEALATSPRNQDRQTMATLAGALGSRQLIGGPWVPANVTALLEGGLEEESAGLLTRGTQTLRTHFSVAEATTATRLVDERITDAGIAFLQAQQQTSRLVVAESLLEPVRQKTTLTATFSMESRRGPLPAAAADVALTGHFTGRDPVLGAHRLLADLAVLYNDDPVTARRGVIVVPPRSWEPDAVFTDELLSGLRSSPILRSVDVDRFFAEVGPATTGSGGRTTPLLRRVSGGATSAAGSALPSSAIRAARRRIEAFASAIDAAHPAGAAMLDRLDRTLLVTTAADLRTRERNRYLAGVEDQVDDQIAGIAMPQNRSITLTAREGEIPVTVNSTLDYPVRAVLRVLSDTLEFPEGASHDLDLPVRRNATSQFAVRAQSSGSFPVRVRVESPDGLVLAESRFTVRSTAISGVGTALSIGAGLFLLVWWANHLRGRRSRRLVPT